jgi:1,4-alpha-glucan branching enzyme
MNSQSINFKFHLPMHSPQNHSIAMAKRYSAKTIAKPIPFLCLAPAATEVHVMGDFNDWDPVAHPMKRQIDGAWRLDIPLNHGHHHYLFRVDGKPMLDPRAQGVARNEQGEKVSLLAVS